MKMGRASRPAGRPLLWALAVALAFSGAGTAQAAHSGASSPADARAIDRLQESHRVAENQAERLGGKYISARFGERRLAREIERRARAALVGRAATRRTSRAPLKPRRVYVIRRSTTPSQLTLVTETFDGSLWRLRAQGPGEISLYRMHLPGDDGPAVEANPDSATTDQFTPVEIEVLANDVGLAEVVSVTDPAAGSAEITGNGTTVTYTTDPDFAGLPPGDMLFENFEYTATDGAGNTATAAVSVNVVSPGTPNTAPVAADDQTTTYANTPVDIHVLDNDTDADGDPLYIFDFTQPTYGWVSFNDDFTILTYTVYEEHYGLAPGEELHESFEYTVSDSHGGKDDATIEVVITRPPPPPPPPP
jgi:hypothetical protein